MFYSVQLLAKKGPLGTVWIAGHLDKRLKRNQIYETNIASSVGKFEPTQSEACAVTALTICHNVLCITDSIINPEAPLALRLSGQLLLGVVRIYSRKITYLYSDCNEALVKIKQVCNPERACYAVITGVCWNTKTQCMIMVPATRRLSRLQMLTFQMMATLRLCMPSPYLTTSTHLILVSPDQTSWSELL